MSLALGGKLKTHNVDFPERCAAATLAHRVAGDVVQAVEGSIMKLHVGEGSPNSDGHGRLCSLQQRLVDMCTIGDVVGRDNPHTMMD